MLDSSRGRDVRPLPPHLFDRLFDAAAAEASESFPNLAGKYDLMADLGVVVDG